MTTSRATAFKDTPTRYIDAGGGRFAYRDLGSGTGVRLLLLNHPGATLDSYDPPALNGLAASQRPLRANRALSLPTS